MCARFVMVWLARSRAVTGEGAGRKLLTGPTGGCGGEGGRRAGGRGGRY